MVSVPKKQLQSKRLLNQLGVLSTYFVNGSNLQASELKNGTIETHNLDIVFTCGHATSGGDNQIHTQAIE